MTKIIINGKRDKEAERTFHGNQHVKIGFFKKAWRTIVTAIKQLIKWSIIVGVIGLTIHYYFPKVMVKIVEREVITDTLTNKIEEVKAGIIADIKKGESQNKPESAGLLIFDSNKQASLGSYQFQIKTVQHYYKKLYGKTITQKEAILIALDDGQAGKLTYDIVFGEKDGYKNWYNTSKKYNIPERLILLANLTN